MIDNLLAIVVWCGVFVMMAAVWYHWEGRGHMRNPEEWGGGGR